MGVVRQQNAMVVIFMHKKSVLERRRITIAWKDQVRWCICRVCIAATSPVTILQNRHCVAVQGTGRRAGARAANGPSQILARHEKSRQIGAAACCGTASARRLTFSQTVWQRAERGKCRGPAWLQPTASQIFAVPPAPSRGVAPGLPGFPVLNLTSSLHHFAGGRMLDCAASRSNRSNFRTCNCWHLAALYGDRNGTDRFMPQP